MDWLRLYVEFSTDPKVQMMSEAMQRRLIMLFCIERGNGIETFHETLRETSLAFSMRISPAELAETKEQFLRSGFINSDWTLRNWSKRQYASDSSTARVRKHRESKKVDETDQGNATKRFSNALEQNRTDTEKATEPKGSVVPGKPATICPHAEIIALYHEILPSLARVREWTDARQALLRKRWSEKSERQSLDWWRDLFTYVATSDFLMGRVESRGGSPFECDLEWLVKPRNLVKVIEGKYENRRAA